MSEINSSDRSSNVSGAATVRALEKLPEPVHLQKVRDGRIAELRQQYEAGKYVVNASQVSAAIIGEHSNVLA